MKEDLEFIPTHIPVLTEEVIQIFEKLQTDRSVFFLDCTAGEGGHSLALMNRFLDSKILAFDRDLEMLCRAKERLKHFSERVKFIHCNYSEISESTLVSEGFPSKVDGILIDAGISMTHFQKSNRGFSIKLGEELDMRLDTSDRLTAKEILKRYTAVELERIFKDFGEERWAKKIAVTLVEFRKRNPIQTTKDLAKFVETVIPRKFWPPKSHPAVRIFQALRIEVNSELEHLQKATNHLPHLLREGGIFSAISFHSLEDRILKHTMKNLEKEGFEILTRKPIIPTDREIEENNSARSSKLRAIRKLNR